MRRILLLVTVAAVMAALLMFASPAFAAPGGQGDERRHDVSDNTRGPFIVPPGEAISSEATRGKKGKAAKGLVPV